MVTELKGIRVPVSSMVFLFFLANPIRRRFSAAQWDFFLFLSVGNVLVPFGELDVSLHCNTFCHSSTVLSSSFDTHKTPSHTNGRLFLAAPPRYFVRYASSGL